MTLKGYVYSIGHILKKGPDRVIVTIKGNMHMISLTGLDSVVKFCLTWSQFTYSVALDAYHIDSVNTCYD